MSTTSAKCPYIGAIVGTCSLCSPKGSEPHGLGGNMPLALCARTLRGFHETFSRGRRSCRYLTNDSGPELTSRETSAKGSPFVSGAPYTKQMRQSGQTRLKSMISVFRVCGRTEWPIMTASTSCCAASMGPCSGALEEMTVKPPGRRCCSSPTAAP